MGVSVRIELSGVKPYDENYKRMSEAFDACMHAGVDVPVAVLEYFNMDDGDLAEGQRPMEEGQDTETLARADLMSGQCTVVRPDAGVTLHSARGPSDYDASLFIEVAKLPKDVKVLRLRMTVS